MGTNAVIAAPTAAGWAGRFVHWDGNPTGVGEALRRIIRRDGYKPSVDVLIEQHGGWSALHDKQDSENPDPFNQKGRFVTVPGFGTADSSVSADEPKITNVEGGDWAEWVYIVTPLGVEVHVRCDNGRLALVSTVAYDDPKGMSVADAEGKRLRESIYA